MEGNWSWLQCQAQPKAPLLIWQTTETQRVIPVCQIAPQSRTSSLKPKQWEAQWRAPSPSPPLHLQLCLGKETLPHPQDWVESQYGTPASWTLRLRTSTWSGVTAGAVRSPAPPPTHLLHLCPVTTCLVLCRGTGSPQSEAPGPTVEEKTLSLCPPHQVAEVRSHVQWAATFYPSNSQASFCLGHLQGNLLSAHVWTTGINYDLWRH